MKEFEHQAKRRLRALVLAALLLAASFVALPNAARAHSFTVALHAVGANQPATLASAIRGMRLAATERDGHADETSDGHLGGLDLFILPWPTEVTHGITWLKGAPQNKPDIIVVIGPPDAAAPAIQASQTKAVAIGSGVLPADAYWLNEDTAPQAFAARFRAAYGVAPDRQAAAGYNAARRIDLAVRAQGGVTDRDDLAEALANTAKGIGW